MFETIFLSLSIALNIILMFAINGAYGRHKESQEIIGEQQDILNDAVKALGRSTETSTKIFTVTKLAAESITGLRKKFATTKKLEAQFDEITDPMYDKMDSQVREIMEDRISDMHHEIRNHSL